ncbi:hypothetical protein K2173_008480 [Erythroxylum novogranatense]|uniref:Uncharacterized protein n=1 Tax=Erythroxylum novogranatense TaxID=1862640 RepID=A0AAV8UBT5_9ROSI|nr:hypothetical protein K2173_008480 [Erythroxylum novogranatense]
MDNNRGSRDAIDSRGKPLKRRSQRRKSTHEGAINMAEARREVAHALHLHRSSSSSSSPSTLGSGNSQFYCYTVSNTLPTPEPVWSTTSPSVLAAPPQGPSSAAGFWWGESSAAETAWWRGFLKNMDRDETRVSPGMFGKSENTSRDGEGPLMVEPSGLSPSTEEWLVFPSSEDQVIHV